MSIQRDLSDNSGVLFLRFCDLYSLINYYWISEWSINELLLLLTVCQKNVGLGPMMIPGVGVGSECKTMINPCLEIWGLL